MASVLVEFSHEFQVVLYAFLTDFFKKDIHFYLRIVYHILTVRFIFLVNTFTFKLRFYFFFLPFGNYESYDDLKFYATFFNASKIF